MLGYRPLTIRSRVAPRLATASNLYERNVVVFADALQNQNRHRGVAGVGHQMWPSRRHGVAFTNTELHLLLRILQEQAEATFQHIKGIADVIVGVPWHGLRRRQLQLADAEAGALQVIGATLDLVEMTGV